MVSPFQAIGKEIQAQYARILLYKQTTYSEQRAGYQSMCPTKPKNASEQLTHHGDAPANGRVSCLHRRPTAARESEEQKGQLILGLCSGEAKRRTGGGQHEPGEAVLFLTLARGGRR